MTQNTTLYTRLAAVFVTAPLAVVIGYASATLYTTGHPVTGTILAVYALLQGFTALKGVMKGDK